MNYWYYLKKRIKQSLYALPVALIFLIIYWWNRNPNNSPPVYILLLIVIAGTFVSAFLRYIAQDKDWFDD